MFSNLCKDLSVVFPQIVAVYLEVGTPLPLRSARSFSVNESCSSGGELNLQARISVTALAAVAALAAAGGVRAQTAYAGGSPDHITVAVPVRASVSASCGFATGSVPSGAKDVGDVTAAFQQDFPFAVACSGPYRVAVVSANGALVVPSPGALPSGYSAAAPYQVRLNLTGDSGLSATGTCDASILTSAAGAPCSFRGPASTTQGLLLSGPSTSAAGAYLRVQSNGYTGASVLIASTAYTDTLTVTLSAAP